MALAEIAATNLSHQLTSARTESDRLFDILKQEALYDRPIDARHRVIFYIGHLDGFDSIQICREALGIKSSDPALDQLFQAGIDPDSEHLPTDTPGDWPSLEQVAAYVQSSRARVDEYLSQVPDDVVSMAIEHRLMHLETLAYMLHNVGYTRKQVPVSGSAGLSNIRTLDNSWCDVPGGIATLGKPQDGTFGWDNEYGQHRCSVPRFQIQQHKVTNGEYLEFVKQGAAVPHFWNERGGKFYYRGMFEEVPLPLDWPVYVTQAEAIAYARFIGKALPSEEQFHRAAYGTPSGREREYPWGSEEPSAEYGNFGLRRWDPESVHASAAGHSAFGVAQLVGNGWEWTNTVFAPFPGFAPRPTYPGYSANFFDGQHYVMKGGSARTATALLRRSFRNWFRSDYPYVYAGFRCVGSTE